MKYIKTYRIFESNEFRDLIIDGVLLPKYDKSLILKCEEVIVELEEILYELTDDYGNDKIKNECDYSPTTLSGKDENPVILVRLRFSKELDNIVRDVIGTIERYINYNYYKIIDSGEYDEYETDGLNFDEDGSISVKEEFTYVNWLIKFIIS